MPETRSLPLSDALSITTGKLLSHDHMDGIYRILGYMTGQDLFTHQLGTAADKCKPALLEQHPFLAELQPPDGADAPDLMAWLAHVEKTHGATIQVQPLAEWTHRDPIEDAADMVGADKVFLPFAKD